MEYVLITQFAGPDAATYLWYVQWTGNEKELTRLRDIIQKTEVTHLIYYISEFNIHTDHRFSEKDIEPYLRIRQLSRNTFVHKVTGKCKFPAIDEEENAYEEMLDRWFHLDLMKDYFKN